MLFSDIIRILYIDSGFFGKQPLFLKTLLENSVEKPDLITFADPTYKGYFIGNNLTELAPILIEAGLSKDKISNHIKSLYETKFKKVKTQKSHLIGKKYREALFEEASNKLNSINQENIADILAEELYNTIKEINDELSANSNVASSKAVTSDEMVAIRLLIGEISGIFKDLQDIGLSIYTIFSSEEREKQVNEKRKELADVRTLFIKKNKELRRYSLVFSELEDVFDKMINLSSIMEFEYSFFSNKDNPCIQQNNEYEKLLGKVKDAISG